MNYLKHYNLLMDKAKIRIKPDGYTERHHIVPRSMNGSDEPSNLVDLTAREHFVAHMMWAKVHGGNQWYSVNVMTHGRQGKYYPNSRLFEIARKHAAEQKSIDMKASNPNNMDGVKEKQSKNNCMHNPIHRAKVTGKNHFTQRPDYICKTSGDNHPMKRPEIRAKFARSNHPNATKIKCIETGVIFDAMELANDWLRSLGKTPNTGNLTTGAQKGKMRYGYHWEYVV